MANSDLKKIVNELGDAVWGSGDLFENWVEPRVHALLQAIDELEAVTAQRDELLAAISECLSEANACIGGIGELSAQLGKIRAISNAAIAKCEVQNV